VRLLLPVICCNAEVNVGDVLLGGLSNPFRLQCSQTLAEEVRML